MAPKSDKLQEPEPSPSEFLISKMAGMDDITQVLIVTRDINGEMTYDSCGQIAADTLGMAEFVRVAASEHLRRQLYGEDDDEDEDEDDED